MLSINMDDVIKVLNSIKSQLIGFGVVAVLLIAVMIACRKQSKSKKYLIRWQAGLGMVLALAITVNLILTGPMYSMVTLATGGGKVSEENVASATQLCENIADEGIVLLDNDGTLPMAKNSKLNVFGWASTNPCYGGTGSGALSDAYPTVTLLEGLKNAGFELNTELSDFYTSYRADRPVVGMFSQDWTLPEPEAAQYTDEMMNNAKAFSDTAMVVITRVGGEGADLPTDVSQVTYDAGHSYNDFEPGDHYLQLSKTEKDMIDLVCKNFDKVVVVYNGANAMELGWVKDYSQIKSVVWCAGTGQSGFNALGSILCGDVNPSGRTIDTFVYDLTQTPTANNFGNFTYTNMDEFKASSFGADTIPAFVNYVEGIYVGYKFYETAAAEGLIDYDKTVVYPFGRGLSYTTFTQTLNSVTEADGTITVDVTVTNTGSASGKEVVEVYYNPPYTNGGIEKASANLIGFAKTSELAPGASENVTVTFKAEDMASYDTYGKGCYVLEKGDYVISINADSHTVLDSKVYNVASDIVYDASNKRESDVEVADNKFDFAEGNVTYLSRANGFANYAEATAAPADFELPAEAKATFYNNSNWNPEDFNNADDVAPTTGAKNGLKLKDMVGVDYNDAQWDAFLDQLTVADMDSLIALGGYQSVAVDSIGKVQAVDCDGPASINNNFTKQGSIGFPSALQYALTVVATAAQADFVSQYPTEAVAALGIVKKLDQLPLYFSIGVSNGLLPLLAYNHAAGNHHRRAQAFRIGSLMSFGFAVLCLVCYEAFATPLVSLFIADAATVRYGAVFLRCMVTAMPMMALCYPMIIQFQAMGRARESLVCSILRKGVLDIPLLYLMDALFPLYGCMWVQPIVDAISLAAALWFYRAIQRGSAAGGTAPAGA